MEYTLIEHKKRKLMKLSLLDWCVASILALKTATNVELGKELDVSPVAVDKSIEYMTKIGVIEDRCLTNIWYDTLSGKTTQSTTNVKKITEAICLEIEKISGSTCQVTKEREESLLKWLRMGFSGKQMQAVLYHKAWDWKDNRDMAQYIRFSTLFETGKFKKYVGEANDFFTDWGRKNRGMQFPVQSLYANSI